jgi:hypothetical protein
MIASARERCERRLLHKLPSRRRSHHRAPPSVVALAHLGHRGRLGLWSVARDACKLAEEDQLDAKPADLECHPRCSWKHASKLGEVLDVRSRTLALCVTQILHLLHNPDYLRPR